MSKLLIAPILVLVMAAPACGILRSAAPTPAAAVADDGSKVIASATELLADAQTAHADGLISEDQLDKVAIVVDKVGHLGIDLKVDLDSYIAARDAGKDVTQYKSVILTAVDSLAQTVADLGKAIPSGTISKIDQIIVTINAVILEIKGGLGL